MAENITPKIVNEADTIWNIDLSPFGCAHCKNTFLLKSSSNSQETICPVCAESKLTKQAVRIRPEPPELLLPFTKGDSDLSYLYNQFANGIKMRPSDLTPENLAARTQKIYFPMWLVDSEIQGIWKAKMGFNYQVKSSQEYYQSGQWNTREIIETRINWTPHTGKLHRHYDNVAVQAISNHDHYTKEIGQYTFSKASAYSPEHLNQTVIRIPDLLPEDSWESAKISFNHAAQNECKKASQGDHIKDFSLNASYDSINWSQLLLPAYITFYQYDDGKPILVYVNGQTGKIGGKRLASQQKGWIIAAIIAAIAATLMLLGLLSLALTAFIPLLSIIGTILIILSFLFGAAALFPVIWPWQWNRKQNTPEVKTQ